MTPEQIKEFLNIYFFWIERLGIPVIIAALGFITIAFLLGYVLRKLIAGYIDQINDLRKQRDKFQDIVAKKISSRGTMENLEGGKK